VAEKGVKTPMCVFLETAMNALSVPTALSMFITTVKKFSDF